MLKNSLLASLFVSSALANLAYVPAVRLQQRTSAPYNVSSLSGHDELGIGSIPSELVKRQTCGSGTGLAQCAGTFGCCLAGDNCCSNGGVLYGCCSAGSSCSSDAFGRLVCVPAGGGGTTSTCAQGFTQCTSFNACCPFGSDCTTFSGNLICAPTNSAPTSVPLTQTTGGTAPGTTPTGGSQAPSNADPSGLSRLLECQPCGKSQCSFTSNANTPDTTYDVVVGSPVSNCNGGNTSVKTVIGGSITIGSSWSIGATVGVDVGVVKLETQSTYGQQKSIQLSQTLEIEVEPGKQGAMIATVSYARTSGTIKIGSGEAFPLVLNQPGNTTYGQQVIACDEKFTANVVSPQKCSSTGVGMVGFVPPSVVDLFLLVVAISMCSYFENW